MTTIYILVKECIAYYSRKSDIVDVEKDWDKICNVRTELIQTIIKDGDPFFEEMIKRGYYISELGVIEYTDFIHVIKAKNLPASGIEFKIIKTQLED